MYNLIILVTTVVFFLLPMLLISALYLLIGLRLRRERVAAVAEDSGCSFGPGALSESYNQRMSKRNLQVTKMLCRCRSLVLSAFLRLSLRSRWVHLPGFSAALSFVLPVCL